MEKVTGREKSFEIQLLEKEEKEEKNLGREK